MACNIEEQKTDYYTEEKDELINFTVDQTIILHEHYLKYVLGLPKEAEPVPDLQPLEEWYPCANSYYLVTEDCDPLERASHLLEEKPPYFSSTSLEGRNEIENSMPYSEQSAQQLYLMSNPISFIIIGKPGIGERELGKALAEFWQCLYIEPDIIIQQEIESGSRAGQCIEFNLRCGKSIGIDVILRLVEKRVNSESAKHRGFVICGLPLIPNKNYEEVPIASESAFFTAKEIFEEVVETTIEVVDPPLSRPQVSLSSYLDRDKELGGEGYEDEEERQQEEDEAAADEELDEEGISIKAAGPAKTTTAIRPDFGEDLDVCYPPEIGTNYEDQLNFLFDLMKPKFLIIHVICNNVDVINKRENYKFDVYSKMTVDPLGEKCDKLIFEYFTGQKFAANRETEQKLDFSSFHNEGSSYSDYLVSLPENFPANVAAQLDSYHYTALRFIERRILIHDPQYFLRVDGRTSISRMLQSVKAKMNILPLQRVVLPRRLNDFDYAEVGEGGPITTNENVSSLQEYFKIVSKFQAPSSSFKWNWSDWGSKCPVSLKNGSCRNGDPNFAVQFMNKVFFLSDEHTFTTFYRNPRPFLLPPYPKPNCKFFIFGPECSGKTAIANCLAYFLNGKVLNISGILQNYLSRTEVQFREKIRQSAIAEALNILNEMRRGEAEINESKRVEQIREWAIKVRDLVQELIQLVDEMNREQTVTKFEISSFPMAIKKIDVAEIETETTLAIRKVRDELELYNINYENEIEYLENLIHDKAELFSHLPDKLRRKIKPVPASASDDFVINYANEAVANVNLELIEKNLDNLVNMFMNTIKGVEDNHIEQGSEGGWILDGMICDLPILERLYPDYIADEVIVLKDTSEDFAFLKNRYAKRGGNMFRDYREFFMNIGRIDAALRAPSPSQISTESYKSKMFHDLISEIIDDDLDIEEDSTVVPTKFENYHQKLAKFRDKWDEVSFFFRKLGIDPIEMEVTGKSLPDLMREIINVIENRYRVGASILTEGDRAEEVQNIINETVHEGELGEGPYTIGAAEEKLLQKNRSYGDTYHYCPVSYYENGVLWRGKEDFAVKFRGSIYLLSSESDMKKFLESPRSYLTNNPPGEIPPPRICVTGVIGSGKTTICRTLSNNFGLLYVNFSDVLKKHFKISSAESLDMLKTNKSIDMSLYDYLNFNIPLPDSVYKSILSKLWFDEPSKRIGFVIDHFPKRPCDVQIMTKLKLIPDIVLSLTGNDEELKTALVRTYMNNWQTQMEMKRRILEEENKDIIAEWEEKRQRRFVELLEEKREERYAEKKKEKESSKTDDAEKSEDPEKSMGAISQVSFDSIAEQKDIDEINRILEVELPDLQIEQSESFEEAKEKYEIFLTDVFSSESEALKNIRDNCDAELIPLTVLKVNLSVPNRTSLNALYIVGTLKKRTLSIFERCYDVSMELAESLLSSGYFFLSRFGKTCPVQYFDNKNPFPMFSRLGPENIHPVVHRSYIYYVMGQENLERFKIDPLKYINIRNYQFPLIPFTVAVTGPPKCGKSTFARRIEDEYGMKVVTRGQAARYVLSCLPFSNLAVNIEKVLRQGWELTDEMVANCVQAACLDPLAVCQGIIYDGFPNTLGEVKHLSYLGLVPNLVIDLQASQEEVLQCLSNDFGRHGFPRFSQHFVGHLWNKWTETAEDFRKWFDQEYQVTTKIPIETSNWSVWWQAKQYITSVFFEIKHYYSHAHKDWPLRLANMRVTPFEFLKRQSPYKTFCPCCLHFSNVLNSGGDPPDRTGLVQWRNIFYWLCEKHIELFLKTPDAYLVPYSNHSLPQHLPSVNYPQTTPDNVAQHGICVVCYKKKLIPVEGRLSFAVLYKDKTYLFSEGKCLQEFMRNPRSFVFDINFRVTTKYPTLDYHELPVLGMLEQYVAIPVIKAVQFICRRRPVIPGLGITASAAIGIGLYFKIFYGDSSKKYQSLYREGDRLYHERREKLLRFLDSMKSVVNPYLHYEEPMPAFRMLESVRSESTESVGTAVSKVIDEIIYDVVDDM